MTLRLKEKRKTTHTIGCIQVAAAGWVRNVYCNSRQHAGRNQGQHHASAVLSSDAGDSSKWRSSSGAIQTAGQPRCESLTPHPSPVSSARILSSCLSVTGFCYAAGRSSADIIAGRLQASQAKELRSFAVLNVAWSSIVRLLLVLVNLPEQAHTMQSM